MGCAFTGPGYPRDPTPVVIPRLVISGNLRRPRFVLRCPVPIVALSSGNRNFNSVLKQNVPVELLVGVLYYVFCCVLFSNHTVEQLQELVGAVQNLFEFGILHFNSGYKPGQLSQLIMGWPFLEFATNKSVLHNCLIIILLKIWFQRPTLDLKIIPQQRLLIILPLCVFIKPLYEREQLKPTELLTKFAPNIKPILGQHILQEKLCERLL